MPTPYKVAQGDTLSAIAAKNNTDINTLLKLNPTITNPDKIYAGADLNLPDQAVAPAATPPPLVASSDEIAAAEAKKKAEQVKTDAEAQAELARLKTQKEIEALKGAVIPDPTKTPAPQPSNFTGDYNALRTEKDALGSSVEDYQANLTKNREARNAITDSLNKWSATASQGQGESAFLSQKSEKERLAQTELDRLDREALVLQNQITNRTDVINTIMGFKKEDYSVASARYDREFANNLSLQSMLLNKQNRESTVEDKAKDNARANLSIIQNEIQKGTLDYDTLDPQIKATIDNLEVQAGLPRGFTQYITANVKGDIVSTSSRSDSAGNEYFDILTRGADGKMGVTSIYKGKGKVSGTDNDEAKQIQEFNKAVADAIRNIDSKGTDYDVEFRALKAQFPEAPDAYIHAKLGEAK